MSKIVQYFSALNIEIVFWAIILSGLVICTDISKDYAVGIHLHDYTVRQTEDDNPKKKV